MNDPKPLMYLLWLFFLSGTLFMGCDGESEDEAAKPDAEAPEEVESVAEGEEGGDMKGYKMVNGKKTSYFHTELTEEAKQLLAANAGPKKLDASALAEMEAAEMDR